MSSETRQLKSLHECPAAGTAAAAALADALGRVAPWRAVGRVRHCAGQLLACAGLAGFVGIGEICRVRDTRDTGADGVDGGGLLAEVVGFQGDSVLLLPYGEVAGIAYGATVVVERALEALWPAPSWQGRVLDPLGRPLDGGPALGRGRRPYPVLAAPLPAERRGPLGPRLGLGVRALDLFTPCRRGQRMGILAGSGVGKSTLLAMLARHAEADALVVGLIGERGREVGEFLHDVLGPSGRARSVVVVATSDQPAMLRRRAAYLTLAVAEGLRDQGLSVLCLIDSVTRFAMALREIHGAAGEAPATKGYPASVFAELPRLLERAGPGEGEGSITGLFTVLVEGDDTSDPIADAVRGILDGHIVLDRAIAESGRYPAIDVARSLSRTAPLAYGEVERELVTHARRLIRTHDDMAELIRLGAYRPGSDPLVDEAILRRPALEALLAQGAQEPSRIEDGIAALARALGVEDATPA